jgi:4-hydroxy-tetrahydrodipicolinate reductase
LAVVLRVGVLGAAGRMGFAVCQAVTDDPSTELVAAIGPSLPLQIEGLVEAGVEVAVDFTNAKAALDNMAFCAERGIHVVSGTSGLSERDLDQLRQLFPGMPPGAANCVWAPNFAIGAVVMMHLATIAARHLEAVEVIEMHHDRKRDAPSGTALETARLMTEARLAAGRGAWPVDATTEETVSGARGASASGAVHVHSVRLPGPVAHQEVIFGAAGQTLSIRHDSYDRTSFMPGVMLAVKEVASRPGLTIGLGELLGL